jgi:hypothetical protein
MADDTNFRSYRPTDPRGPAQAAPVTTPRQGGNDPLAELARLIGQTEPFGNVNQGAPSGAAPAPVRQPMPVQPAAHRPVQSDPYGSPLDFSGLHFNRRAHADPQQQNFRSDPTIHAMQEQQPDSGYPSEAYYEDPARVANGDEAYEDDYVEERPRYGIMKLAAVVAGLAILGGGGVLGYRVLSSGGPSSPPPVIKANTAPSKIVPAPNAEASNKQIRDRVGEAAGERVVSREEKPIEVKDNSRPPRVAYPGMPASPGAEDNAMATASPPLNTDPGGPASAEPRKIRTVTIRPDGTGSTPPMPRQAATPPSTRTAAAGPAAPTAAASPAQGNAPLSLSPQVANAEASARPAFPPPPAAAAPTRVAAVPPPAEVAAGGYTVQISSQRSETEAQASFRSLQAKYPSVLGDRQPIIRRADLGDKGIYFRAMVGPFASSDQAAQFCGSLKSAGGQCVVQRN